VTTWLAVMGAALAGFAALDAVRPARGAADRTLRAVGGGALLALSIAAAAAGAVAGAVIAGLVALPLLLAPALPWAISRIAARAPEADHGGG
jgi:hypothetical protein